MHGNAIIQKSALTKIIHNSTTPELPAEKVDKNWSKISQFVFLHKIWTLLARKQGFWKFSYALLFCTTRLESILRITQYLWKSVKWKALFCCNCELKSLSTEMVKIAAKSGDLITPKAKKRLGSRTTKYFPNSFETFANCNWAWRCFGALHFQICQGSKKFGKCFVFWNQTNFRFWGHTPSRFGCKFLHFGWQAFECATQQNAAFHLTDFAQ